jgi:hypothetical protein
VAMPVWVSRDRCDTRKLTQLFFNLDPTVYRLTEQTIRGRPWSRSRVVTIKPLCSSQSNLRTASSPA